MALEHGAVQGSAGEGKISAQHEAGLRLPRRLVVAYVTIKW